MKTIINLKINELRTVKGLVRQFQNNKKMSEFALEKKVATILNLPKGYSQELYYERLNSLSSQTNQKRLSN